MRMMQCAGLAIAGLGLGMMQGPPADRPNGRTSVAATSRAAVSEWDQKIAALTTRGDLRASTTRQDTMIPGRSHTRFEQLYKGVPVWGGELVRQEDAAGTLTVFGGVYEGIDLDTRNPMSEAAARSALLRGRPEGSALFPDEATLTVLPKAEGGYALTWRARVGTGTDILMTFIDATSGAVVMEYSDKQTQSAVGKATGVLGDAKKISVTGVSGTFQALDALRPLAVQTLDMKFVPTRIDAIFSRFPNSIVPSDYAADSDNDWTDGAAVDAQVYSGFTYDYYFKRFGRRGLDNANITIRSFVHMVRREDLVALFPTYPDFYLNAFYAGSGVMVYGEGLPANFTFGGQRWNYFSGALDIVGHELSHGVTGFTSRLIYQGESGALNEAFSDIMGTSIEFYFQPPGDGPLMADYLEGEDIVTAGPANPRKGIRSMQNPALFGDPDHYSVRFTGPQDNGGVHTNSGIANNAYYLAIEGGTHRLGARVSGVGAANREQIERVFYRGFTSFLVPSANFAAARVATIQAARELYPGNAAVEAAVAQAWTAVGVN